MKKVLIAFVLSVSIALVGCDTMPKKEDPIVVKYKYIINTIPSDMMTIPDRVAIPDPKAATDLDVGNYIIDSEKRSLDMESKLKSIKDLQDKRLEDAKKLNKDDVIVK